MTHRTSLIQNTSASYAAICEDCPEWMGGDGSREEAEQDAGMHQHGEHHPWNPAVIEEWTPDKNPFYGT